VGTLLAQLLWLLILAIPISSVAWTVTHEDIFREPRDYCKDKSETASSLWRRKFFYLFTCEYCFSHYVTVGFLAVTRFHLLYPDWRGYLVSLFALVWVANLYMGVFARLRLDIRHDRIAIKSKDLELQRMRFDSPNEESSTRAEDSASRIERFDAISG
jgi:hypothetical protein